VGKDLYAICGKCEATWHVIVSLAAGKVTRVQCKQCMAYHRYRAPEGEENVNRKPAPTTTRRAIGAKKTARRTKASGNDLRMPLIQADLSRPIRLYAMNETYAPGDRIAHPKFGQGVVEAAPAPGKIEVCFPDGQRVLAHAR